MGREILSPSGAGGGAIFGVKAGEVRNWLFIAGTVPRDLKNAVVAKGDFSGQMARVFANVRDILAAGGFSMKDLIQLNVYLTDERFRPTYRDYARQMFPEQGLAQTILVVRGLNNPDFLIEVDGIACR
jgi:2-iminobutanoate/2-iminopropanoate deaminase